MLVCDTLINLPLLRVGEGLWDSAIIPGHILREDIILYNITLSPQGWIYYLYNGV